MILEDEQMMARLLSTLLKMEGFEVILPETLRDLSPKSILAYGPDTLFMDVNLHEKSSIPLLRDLRKRKKGLLLNVVMTSGLDLKKECIDAGANFFLQKPYMPDELIKILKDHCQP